MTAGPLHNTCRVDKKGHETSSTLIRIPARMRRLGHGRYFTTLLP